MTDAFRLDGKVAVVTGGSQGIGRAVSLGLAAAGATVVVTDVRSSAPAASQVCKEIESAGGTARTYELDVTKVGEVTATMDRIANDASRIDILVNNAGVRVNKPSLDVAESDWDAVLNVNLKGLFFCTQAAARRMATQGGGRIINIASQLGVQGAPERAAYSASKGGVVNLTKALAVEWAKLGITVNAVGPGPTETPMVADTPAAARLDLQTRSPIGRRLEPDEIVGAVVFLASPAASAVNGHLLMVDAGWTAW